jgi:hypothetical protein
MYILISTCWLFSTSVNVLFSRFEMRLRAIRSAPRGANIRSCLYAGSVRASRVTTSILDMFHFYSPQGAVLWVYWILFLIFELEYSGAKREFKLRL